MVKKYVPFLMFGQGRVRRYQRVFPSSYNELRAVEPIGGRAGTIQTRYSNGDPYLVLVDRQNNNVIGFVTQRGQDYILDYLGDGTSRSVPLSVTRIPIRQVRWLPEHMDRSLPLYPDPLNATNIDSRVDEAYSDPQVAAQQAGGWRDLAYRSWMAENLQGEPTEEQLQQRINTLQRDQAARENRIGADYNAQVARENEARRRDQEYRASLSRGGGLFGSFTPVFGPGAPPRQPRPPNANGGLFG